MIAPKRTAAGLSVALFTALAVSACGGSGKSSKSAVPGAGSTSAEISRAADVSESTKGYTFDMTIRESVQGELAAQIDGGGTYSAPSRSLTMTLTTHADGKATPIQEIVIGPKIWVKEPPSVASKLPGGKPWLEIDLSKVRKQSLLGAVSTLTSSSSNANPAQALQYLKAESSRVQDLGATVLDGVPVTHYRFTINLANAGAGRSAAVRQASKNLVKQLPGKILNENAIPFDVWIDGAHLVRKLSYTVREIPKGINEPIDASLTMQMTHYGPQSTPTPPPADQTGNLLALLQAEGKSGAL